MATSSEAFKSFRGVGVVVFADTRNEYRDKLPAGATAAMSEAGGSIPRVLVTSADGSSSIQGIGYTAMRDDMRGTVRALRNKLKTVDVMASASEESDDDKPAAEEKTENKLFAESQAWTNADGVEIKAAIKKVEGTEVEFLMPNGSAVKYPLAKLSKASQEKIAELQKKAAE